MVEFDKQAPCIFCGKPVGADSAEEHLVPAGAGNMQPLITEELTLAPGFICRRCNNGPLSGLDRYFIENDVGKVRGVLGVPGRPRPGRNPNWSPKTFVSTKSGFVVPGIEPVAGQRVSFQTKPNPVPASTLERMEGTPIRFDLQLKIRHPKMSAFLSKLLIGFLARQHGRQVALAPQLARHRRAALSQGRDGWLPYYRAGRPDLSRGVNFQVEASNVGLEFVYVGLRFFTLWAPHDDRLPEFDQARLYRPSPPTATATEPGRPAGTS